MTTIITISPVDGIIIHIIAGRASDIAAIGIVGIGTTGTSVTGIGGIAIGTGSVAIPDRASKPNVSDNGR